MTHAPLGLPNRIWIVVFRSNGERHLIYKEPIEGIAAWAAGSDAIVAEYRFGALVHGPAEEKKK